MFLRWLSSSFSSSLPPLPRASLRSSSSSSYRPRLMSVPHPWWSVQGFPPWPPRLRPSARHTFASRTPLSLNPGSFGSWRSFHASVGLMMECPDRDKEPPYKRRKSLEEKGSSEGHRRGAEGGMAKDGGARRQHPDPGKDRLNHRFKDGSRDKDGERTKDRQRSREDQRRGGHQWEGRRDPGRPEQDPAHRPNPWFKERSAEELRGPQRDNRGPADQIRHEGGVPGPWTRITSQPQSTTRPPNPGQATGAHRQLPPPGVPQPVRPLQRHWEACCTEPRPPGVSTVFDFSVMSYNVLSQELLQDNAYLYQHCDPAILSWDYRLPHLLKEIQLHNADIMCLQEVQADHYQNQMKPALQSLGYHCEYKKRTGKKPDGCAVVFKNSRFSLVSSNPVEFFRPGDALLDRDNVGLVLLLQPKDSVGQSDPSSFICVANTHLLYNPRRGDIKLAQLAILLAEISRLSSLPGGSTCPVVLCGDFNSTPQSPLYSFLTKGCLDYRGMQISMVSGQESVPRGQRLLMSPIWSPRLGINRQCQYDNKPTAELSPSSPTAVEGAISNLTVEDVAAEAAAAAFSRTRLEHSLKLQSSYRHQLMPDGRPEITTCHSRTAMTVDYILYSPGSTTPSLPGGRGLQLLSRLSLVGQAELEEVKGLPNQHHSSDHLPLLAFFRCLL
ncbi:protein angel homolog 2 [Parambassis ranga]|uniref:Protein angel homolog 2-like n=1 Tax=Parambassis ranga TaxID=210632 RepID=A0A6P7HTU1_9TELE|nr:protein angel homolog 2-like [Parambassis ranga]XP_028253972.1 protein angel homolog 2-like [Parambassis ranga]